jgi:hypothetical protein
LQYELGIYLRRELNKGNKEQYHIYFEKNTKMFLDNPVSKDGKDDETKHEVDLIIIKKEKDKITEKYAIELKFPINGQYPEQMKKFIADINFMKRLYDAWDKEKAGKINTYCLTLVNDNLFYEATKRSSKKDLYKLFRGKEITDDTPEITAQERIIKDDKNKAKVTLNNAIQWNSLSTQNDKNDIWYYLINIATDINDDKDN